MRKAQETYRTPPNGPIYLLRETQKKKRERKGAESLFKEGIEFLKSREEN